MTENPLGNEGRRASWWPWITESAGEPEISVSCEHLEKATNNVSVIDSFRQMGGRPSPSLVTFLRSALVFRSFSLVSIESSAPGGEGAFVLAWPK